MSTARASHASASKPTTRISAKIGVVAIDEAYDAARAATVRRPGRERHFFGPGCDSGAWPSFSPPSPAAYVNQGIECFLY